MDAYNPRYKLLVSDIDGTLANADGLISDTDLDALRRIHEQGVTVSLSTGRPAEGCREFLDRVGTFGPHIFFDGAVISDSSLTNTVYRVPIDYGLCREIIDLADSCDLVLELFSVSGYFIQQRHALAEIHAGLLRVAPVVTSLRHVAEKEMVILGCVVIHAVEEENLMQLFSRFQDRLSIMPSAHPAYPDIRMVNITAPGINKGIALGKLTEYLGVTRHEVIAIGDGENDIPLLEHAGLAVAMANAPESVKKVAHYITAHVDQNGLAQAIRYAFS